MIRPRFDTQQHTLSELQKNVGMLMIRLKSDKIWCSSVHCLLIGHRKGPGKFVESSITQTQSYIAIIVSKFSILLYGSPEAVGW